MKANGGALLEARGLWFAYAGGGPEAVRGATLAVERGRLSAVVGANGSGKSTLVRLMAGLLKGSRGEVLFDGKPLDSLDARASARGGSRTCRRPSRLSSRSRRSKSF